MRDRIKRLGRRLETTCFDAGGPIIILFLGAYFLGAIAILTMIVTVIVAVTIFLIRRAKKKMMEKEDQP